MSAKIYVFERTQREEVVASSEEEARRAFWDEAEWSLVDVRDCELLA